MLSVTRRPSRKCCPAAWGRPGLFLAAGVQPVCASQTVSLQGRLTGLGGEDLPTIVIVAHYDAFGVAPVCMRALWGRGTGTPHPRSAPG